MFESEWAPIQSERGRQVEVAPGTTVTLLITAIVGLAIPFAGLAIAAHYNLDYSRPVYVALLIAFGISASFMLFEALFAIASPRPTDLAVPYPPATAIILSEDDDLDLAHDSIDALMRMPYPGQFQIVLLYRPTGSSVALEALKRLALQNRNLFTVAVDGDPLGRPCLQRALELSGGELVALFGAGQRPSTGSFARAWDWLSSGYEAVGGRVIAANPSDVWGRILAIESPTPSSTNAQRLVLSALDALRAGNTYWRRGVALEMAKSAPENGFSRERRSFRGIYDRGIVAWGPTSHGFRQFRDTQIQSDAAWLRFPLFTFLRRVPGLRLGQRFLILDGVVWRQCYSWLSLQILTVSAFWAWKTGSVHRFHWLIPIVILVGLYVVVSPLVRSLLAYVLAPRQLKRHALWFVQYFLVSLVFYGWFRGNLNRSAQLGVAFGRPPAVPKVSAAVESEAADRVPQAEPLDASLSEQVSEPVHEGAPPLAPEEAFDAAAAQVPLAGELEEPGGREETALRPPIDFQAVIANLARGEERRSGMSDDDESTTRDIGNESTTKNESVDGARIVAAAETLAAMVRSLVAELDHQAAERSRLLQRIQVLERQAATGSAAGIGMADLQERPFSDEQLSELTEVTGSLVNEPGHILVLASISQHAPELAEVVRRYVQIQRAAHARPAESA